MIKVYVREVSQGEGRLLGEFPPESINALVGLFKRYEVRMDAADDPCDFVGAQFSEYADGVVFEVIVDGTSSIDDKV